MVKLFLVLASFFAGSSVLLGAFAAHGLKGRLAENLLTTFQTGAQYQMYHALALLASAILLKLFELSYFQTAAWFFIAGIVLFSGSLYMLALTQISVFGPVTPLGGICFVIGWIMLGLGAAKAI